MEIKKNDRVYSLAIPQGAPYGELYDALFNMLQDVVELSKKAADQAKPAEEVSATPESESAIQVNA